jgi:hypothetical protein
MSKTTKSNAAEKIHEADRDAELIAQLDDLVREATRGCRRAIGALAIAFGPRLTQEAREELGPRWEQESADVIQDFFLAMCEGRLVFPAIRGAAIPWMTRIVREMARKYLRDREPPGGMAG